MLIAILDYFWLNRWRALRGFFAIYLLFLVGLLVVIVQTRPTYTASMLVSLGVVSGLYLAVLVALFVIVVGVLDVYLRIARRARACGLSIDDYVRSDDYREHVVEVLMRTDKEARWH